MFCGQKVTTALQKLNAGASHLLSNGLLIEQESLSIEDFDDYREAESIAMTKKKPTHFHACLFLNLPFCGKANS